MSQYKGDADGKTRTKNTTDGTKSDRISNIDKSDGSKHEHTWSKTDYASNYGAGRHTEGWHGSNYDKTNGQNKK